MKPSIRPLLMTTLEAMIFCLGLALIIHPLLGYGLRVVLFVGCGVLCIDNFVRLRQAGVKRTSWDEIMRAQQKHNPPVSLTRLVAMTVGTLGCLISAS